MRTSFRRFSFCIFATALLLLLLAARSDAASASSGSTAAGQCSILDAIYKPHPDYFLPGALPKRDHNLSFELTVHEPLPGEKAAAHRNVFFHIDAFDARNGTKLSTIRLADSCSSGISICSLSTYEGQFNSNESMKELKAGFSFEPIAFNEHFFPVPFWGPSAPHVIVLPQTGSKLYYSQNNRLFREAMNEFVRFHTPDRVFPDFGGYDVWMLDSCEQGKAG